MKDSNKSVIVAGAGHGGLCAAIKLGRQGMKVKVIEKEKRENVGLDWHDVTVKDIFNDIGIDVPDNEYTMPYFRCSFTHPKKTYSVSQSMLNLDRFVVIDRKYLLRLLIEEAEKSGVEFLFDTPVLGAICTEKGVHGVKTARGFFRCNLVIDAAGADSPVRKSLPGHFGIQNELSPSSVFYCYRAYFEKTSEKKQSPEQMTYFYHNNRPGMDWLITDEKFADVLVGGFEPIDADDVDRAVDAMIKDFPYFTKKVIRGGAFEKIPLGKALPLFVYNGYAAVGNSASMIEPMSGSGISKSIKAGSILAQCVLNIDNGVFTKENLWRYQYEYMKQIGHSVFGDEVVRKFMSGFSAEDVDYLFESKLMTEKLLYYKNLSHDTPLEIANKVVSLLPKPEITLSLIKMLSRLRSAQLSQQLLPEVYSDEGFARWKAEYDKI
ncbi:MAG: NAD(P)/FAD-dependent oxidoreductase [Clostridiales bacterium]|nr:NAD(P)/FAD-dependent oxidoreductase [Clostridiales bacterium]